MRTYARVAGGLVAELVSTDRDITTMFHPELDFVEVVDAAVGVGWRWSGAAFSPPAPRPVEPVRQPSLAELQAALAALAGQIAALQSQG